MGKSGRAKGIWHLVRIGPFYVDAAGLYVTSRELEICNGMMNLRLDFGDYHTRLGYPAHFSTCLEKPDIPRFTQARIMVMNFGPDTQTHRHTQTRGQPTNLLFFSCQ